MFNTEIFEDLEKLVKSNRKQSLLSSLTLGTYLSVGSYLLKDTLGHLLLPCMHVIVYIKSEILSAGGNQNIQIFQHLVSLRR